MKHSEIKKFSTVFGRRLAKTAVPEKCQNCDCKDDVSGTSQFRCIKCPDEEQYVSENIHRKIILTTSSLSCQVAENTHTYDLFTSKFSLKFPPPFCFYFLRKLGFSSKNKTKWIACLKFKNSDWHLSLSSKYFLPNIITEYEHEKLPDP